MMTEIATVVLLAGGTLFMLITAVGLLRMPDLFLRMHALTKAGTLGIGLCMLGAAIFFGELDVVARALAVVVFVFLTAPVSAHMIARAGYLAEVHVWERTRVDEMRDYFTEQVRAETADDPAPGDAPSKPAP